jgi:vitamin B12 transporter
LIEDKTETAQAVYGQIRTTKEQLENSSLAFGVRYNTTSGTFDGTVWNFSGQHDFTPSFYLRGQIGTSFRLPDAEELYLKDCCEVGNPNLEPEESENVEVAIGGQSTSGKGLSWQFIVFRRDVDNLIDIDFDNPAFPRRDLRELRRDARNDGLGGLPKLRPHGDDEPVVRYTDAEAKFKGTSTQVQRRADGPVQARWNYHAMRLPRRPEHRFGSRRDVYDTSAAASPRRSRRTTPRSTRTRAFTSIRRATP